MAEIELPVWGFAQMMECYLRGSTARVSRLRDLKFPSRDSAPYYAAAIARIYKYVAGRLSYRAVLEEAATMRKNAPRSKSPTRLVDNAAMIESFVRTFDMGGVTNVRRQTFVLELGNVSIRVTPDFCLDRHGRIQVVKLLFGKSAARPAKRRARQLMSQLIFEAVRSSATQARHGDVVLVGVASGTSAPALQPRRAVVQQWVNLATEIAALWPTLEPRTQRQRAAALSHSASQPL